MDIADHYRELLKRHGDGHAAAQYSSVESQELRYAPLLNIGDINNKKILDFGCGTGHLATYIKKLGVEVNYTGVDIVDDFFPLAKEKHPEHRFTFYEEIEEENFDFIFISGVFNNKIGNNRNFFISTIKNLFSKANSGIAFNLMSTYVDYQASDLWYTDPCEIFHEMKMITPYVNMINDYIVKENSIPFEYVIHIYKNPKYKASKE